jgi:superfamily II RNA helicase
MQETARRISRVSNESKLQVDEEEYVNKFRSELMDVVYQWCKVVNNNNNNKKNERKKERSTETARLNQKLLSLLNRE